MAQARALRLSSTDNVAVCTVTVQTGDEVWVKDPDGARFLIVATSDIAYCNKIALKDIRSGEEVRKYGEIIGRASADIPKGSLANDRNIASQPRSYAEEYLLSSEI
ncbi:MAG: UxaA family hydrolase [Sutterellaceae bacterium]|nr:UxaA family hydrolase [Sutterellaceae bacterium]MDD7442761.1 UxaA family hydrolase [Sutterellaceae bacterium]MDY2867550.1 UxaA family hydrolase [Mesosutterella sp.]